jgi:predicted lipid carrier protein YhbT
MATVRQCRSALNRLAGAVGGLDDETKARHLPRRVVQCTVKDLGVVFGATVDETGVHDIVQLDPDEAGRADADVRVTVRSDDLVGFADGTEDFVSAWLRGRVQVAAPMRDMLRLRSLLGL